MPYIGQRPATGEANSFKILDDISNYTLTFGSSDIDVSADTITAREHRFVTGQRVTYGNGGGTDPTGLSNGTVYYIIVEDRHTFKLATSASNAVAGTAINITAAGAGAAHTINVAFDGVNTKFKATHTNGTKADISQSGQLMVSVNGVLQQPHDNTTTPTTGYATDHTSTIIFSAAPAAGDQFFGRLIASNFATFDISDNTVDNFTGDGSTSTFTLSKIPPNNESILVTIDGVVQYPDDNAAVRAYTVSENILDFASAPGNAVEIQVRHIGFAGASTAGISGFYGRTGNAVLKNTDDIVFRNANVGVVTATDIRITGNLTVDGTTTTLDTDLIGVDKLEVDANNTTVAAAITQRGSGDILNLYDGSTEVFSVLDGGAVRIGGNAVSGAAAGVVLQDGTGVIATRSSASSPVFRGYTQGDSSANFTVKADGKLLLGTETAGISGAHNLTIGESGHGGITIRTGTASAGAIYFADSTSGDAQFDGFIQYNQQTRYLRFGTAQAEQVRITSGGLVGIGTDIPESNSRLHTFTTQTTARTITETSSASGYAGYRLTNGTGYWEMQVDGSNQGLRFLDDGTERLRIDANGDITTSGPITTQTSSSPYENNRRVLEVHGGSTQGWLAVGATRSDTDAYVGGINFLNRHGQTDAHRFLGYIRLKSTHVNTGQYGTNVLKGQLEFATKSPAAGISSTTPDMVISPTGNVGINQASPNAPLSFASAIGQKIELHNSGSNNEFGIGVQSSELRISTGTNSRISFFTNGYSGNERLRIHADGEVECKGGGAGQNALLVTGNYSASNNVDIQTWQRTGGAVQAKLIYKDADTSIHFGTDTAHKLCLMTGGTEKVRITSDGKVGINVTSPDSTFHVNSGAENVPARFESTGTVSRIGFKASGTSNSYRVSCGAEAEDFVIYTSNSEKIRVDSVGRLLIGRTTQLASSAERLTIDNGMALFRRTHASAGAVYIRNEDSTADTRQAYLIFMDGGGNRGGFGIQNDASRLWISGQNGISFRTSGSAPSQNERLRITTGGQVNIGGDLTQTGFTANITRNSSETDILRIKGNVGNAFIRFQDNDSSSNFTLGADDAVGSGGFALYDRSDSAYRVVVDTNGNFGINDTNPGRRLSINNGIADEDIIKMYNDEVGINFGAWGTGSAYPREATINGTRFDSGSSPFLRIGGQGGIKLCADLNNERMRIRTDGHVASGGSLVASANYGDVTLFHSTKEGCGMYRNNAYSSCGAHIAVGADATDGWANLYLNRYWSSGEDERMIDFRLSNVTKGTITSNSSGTTYNTTSDIRLKTDINPISDATDKLMNMNPVTHKWKEDPDGDTVHGFIAQEMQNIAPEAVHGEPDGEMMMGMDYGRITPIIVAALQDAIEEINTLKQRISELEN